jgi:hypothetical protein
MSFEFGPDQTKWLEALESGKYTQDRGSLRGFAGYCCLGVADEVCGLHERASTMSLVETFGEMGLRNSDGASVLPVPGTLVEWLRSQLTGTLRKRLEDRFRNSGIPFHLTWFNDELRLNFKQIAHVLRTWPEVYFTGPK